VKKLSLGFSLFLGLYLTFHTSARHKPPTQFGLKQVAEEKYDESRKNTTPQNVASVARMRKETGDTREWVQCLICGDLCPQDAYGVHDAHITCTYSKKGKRIMKLQRAEEKKELLADVRPGLF